MSKNVKKVYQRGFASKQTVKFNPRLAKVLSVAQNLPRKKSSLLDLGCGDGSFTKILAKTLEVKNLYGVDIAQNAVNLAKKAGIKAVRLDVDEKRLPFKNGQFDFIYCGNLIELIYDPDHLLDEIFRTLKKDGSALVTFPNLASWLSRIAVLAGFLPYYSRVSVKYDIGKMFISVKKGRSTGFIRLQTLKSFIQLANLHGFRVEKIIGAREISIPFMLKTVDFLLTKKPSLAFQIICVLRKVKRS